MSGEVCRHRIAVGQWCAACDLYDEPATAPPRVPSTSEGEGT